MGKPFKYRFTTEILRGIILKKPYYRNSNCQRSNGRVNCASDSCLLQSITPACSMDQRFQHQRADPPLLPASRALSLPGSNEPLDAFPPLLAISWTSSFGLLAKLPGFVWPVAEVVPAVSSEPPESPAPRDWPPLLAISCTSSLGLLAKLPGFVFPVEDMTRCWHRKDICSWMNTGEEAAFVDTIKFEA